MTQSRRVEEVERVRRGKSDTRQRRSDGDAERMERERWRHRDAASHFVVGSDNKERANARSDQHESDLLQDAIIRARAEVQLNGSNT